jgi:protein-L-isoaspartate(D-aspartate) O-methyltransferase
MPMGETRPLRHRLVEELRRSSALADEAVADAFLAVPRHLFVPGVPPERAYRDEAIATKIEGGRPVSSSSQPAIMAIMLEQLDVRPGMRVLEIGAGTGYNAALLQHLVGPRGRVVTIDIDPEVVAWARERLQAALDAWSSAGRPSFDALTVTAQPLATAPEAEPSPGVVETRWWWLRFAWQ